MWKLNLFGLFFSPPRIVSQLFDSAVTPKIVTRLLSLVTVDQMVLILGFYINRGSTTIVAASPFLPLFLRSLILASTLSTNHLLLLLLMLLQLLHELLKLLLLLLLLQHRGVVLFCVSHGHHCEDEVDEVEGTKKYNHHEEDHVRFPCCTQRLWKEEAGAVTPPQHDIGLAMLPVTGLAPGHPAICGRSTIFCSHLPQGLVTAQLTFLQSMALG